MGCEKQPVISDILRQADDAYQAAENNRKKAADALDTDEKDIRKIIAEAHDRPVACLYVDQNSGELGTVVTVSYFLNKDNELETMIANDPLKP